MRIKNNRWGSRMILIILSSMIVGASLTGLALAKGEQNAGNSSLNKNAAGASDLIAEDTKSVDQSSPESLDPVEESVVDSVGYEFSKEQEKIDQIKEKTIELRSSRLRKEDTFNYTKTDIEKLLLSGSTVEDIYLSDQIANEWIVNPHQLVELKRQSAASWDEIADAIRLEKESRLNELLDLYPDAEQQFAKSKISIAEKVEALEILNEKGNKETLDKAIQEVANNQVSRKVAYSISILNLQEDIGS